MEVFNVELTFDRQLQVAIVRLDMAIEATLRVMRIAIPVAVAAAGIILLVWRLRRKLQSR